MIVGADALVRPAARNARLDAVIAGADAPSARPRGTRGSTPRVGGRGVRPHKGESPASNRFPFVDDAPVFDDVIRVEHCRGQT